MKDLFTFLNEVSVNSDFKAELSNRGGFITFSNSGRRGGVKYFQIGLDNILQTLKDILNCNSPDKTIVLNIKQSNNMGKSAGFGRHKSRSKYCFNRNITS